MQTELTPARYVKLDNRPGALDHLTRVLRDRKINIDSMSLESVGSTGFARILTSKNREAIDALRQGRLDVHDTQLLLMRIENRPGELNRLTSELAAAGINIEAVLTTIDGRVALRTNDNETASRILGKL